jgi:hypothetical protein
MSVTNEDGDGEELLGIDRMESLVETWGVDTHTFHPPHASDDNPFRSMPKGIHFEGYRHTKACCGRSARDKGVLSDYTGMIGGGYMTVYLCESCLSVWLRSFGWSEQREYPENHIFHPDNR